MSFREGWFKIRCDVEFRFWAEVSAGGFGAKLEFRGTFGRGEGARFGVGSFASEDTTRAWVEVSGRCYEA